MQFSARHASYFFPSATVIAYGSFVTVCQISLIHFSNSSDFPNKQKNGQDFFDIQYKITLYFGESYTSNSVDSEHSKDQYILGKKLFVQDKLDALYHYR